ncbi:hypothetical protein V6N11_081497 [Hibiscus sabdariffa]|uniref:Uncharacterized protein n=1 Tax=Hibiscus sabdariffa TaxID=183260 RepID=A0ABR2A4M9_9ROSI
MVRRNPNVSGKKAAASWEWNADDVEVFDDDYVIYRKGPIPSIKFSDRDNCVGSGGFPDVSANDKGKNLDHASSSTYPVEPSELAPYGPWMTVDNRRRKPLRGSAVANSGPRLAPLRVKEGVLMQRRGGPVTKQVSSNVQGDHMPMQGRKATMKGGTKQTKVAQDLPSTGSRFAALRMEDGASFMESDVEETGYVPRSVNVGTTTSGEVQVINSEKQPAQGSSIAIENGDSDGSEKNAEQLEELSVSDVSIGKKETTEQVKEMPAMEVSVGSKHHVGNVKVVPILADHVVEILSQETVGSDKHMAVMLAERKQSKLESAGGKVVKARSWADRSSEEGYRKGFYLRKQAMVKSRPLSTIQEWAQNLSHQLESNAVIMGKVGEVADVASTVGNVSSLTKGEGVAEANEPL